MSQSNFKAKTDIIISYIKTYKIKQFNINYRYTDNNGVKRCHERCYCFDAINKIDNIKYAIKDTSK